MSSMTRIALSKGVSYVPRRYVSDKPQSILGRRIVAPSDAPSGVMRRASQVLYANFFRRNAVFITGVLGAAVVLTGAYDYTMDSLWEYNNKGKLFHDVIPKRFPNLPPNTEPEGGDEDAGEVSAEDDPSSSDNEVETEKEESGQKEEDQPAETDANKSDETKEKEEANKRGEGNTADKNDAKGQTPIQRHESTEGNESNQQLKDQRVHDKQPNTGTASKGPDGVKDKKTETDIADSKQKADDTKAAKAQKEEEDKQQQKKKKPSEEKEKSEAAEDESAEEAAAPALAAAAATKAPGGSKQRTTEDNSKKPTHKQDSDKATEQEQHTGGNKLHMKAKDLSQHQDQSTPKGQDKNEKPQSADTGAKHTEKEQKKAGKKEEDKQAGGVKHNQSTASTSAATGDFDNKAKKAPGGGSQEDREEAKDKQREENKKPAAEKK